MGRRPVSANTSAQKRPAGPAPTTTGGTAGADRAAGRGNGSGAVILAGEDFVDRHGLAGQAVEIIGQSMVTDLEHTFTAQSAITLVGAVVLALRLVPPGRPAAVKK